MRIQRIPVAMKWWMALAVALALLPIAVIAGDEPNLDKQLIRAAGRGDVPLVKQLLQKGAKVNAQSEKGISPIMMASLQGKTQVAEVLVNRGADVNAMEVCGLTTIMAAIRSINGYQTELPKLLLRKGADVNVKGPHGFTALTMAVARGYTDVVRLLLDSGADVNAVDDDVITPLMFASRFFRSDCLTSGVTAFHAGSVARADMVKLLLEKGADVNRTDRFGNTALAYAARFQKADAVQQDVGNGTKDAAACEACARDAWKRQDEVVRRLRDHGAELTLRIAAMLGDTDTLESLIQPDIDLNAKDKRGVTVLIAAVERGHADVVKMLLDKGADPNAADDDGRTALMVAAGMWVHKERPDELTRTIDGEETTICPGLFGYPDIARLLLDRGANVNARSKDGSTALTASAETGDAVVTKLLLDRGADVNPKTNGGSSALSAAVCSLGSERTGIMKLLLDRGADLHRSTVLLAASEGHPDVVKLLLERGLKANTRDKAGVTPLMRAASNGRLAVVNLLLDRGADIDAKDQAGKTALMLAVTPPVQPEVVQLLLEKGAEVNARDSRGRTALQEAEATGRNNIVSMLLRYGAKQ